MSNVKKTHASSAFTTGCLILFGLPFFGAGVAAFIAGINKVSQGEKDAIILICVGGLFACVGLGIMLAGIFAGRMAKKRKGLEQQFPDEPWRWRENWKSGIITSNAAGGVIGIGIFALVWNAISWTVIFVAPWQKEVATNKAALLALLFPAVGVILIIVFFYHLLRSRKYGKSVIRLDTYPGVVGGHFRGTVRVPAEVYPEGGFKISIRNVQQYESGSGKNRSTSERMLWEDGRTVKDFKRRNRTTEIPIAFTIPSSSSETTLTSPGADVIWRVSITADTPGIDYASAFEVPIFVTAESSDDVDPDLIEYDENGLSVKGSEADTTSFRDVCKELDIELNHPGRGRLTLSFSAGRNKGSACGTFIFFLIWTGIVVALFMSSAPFFFGVIFGLFDLILLMIVVSLSFTSAKIEVNSRNVTLTKKIMGFGGTKAIRCEDLESIKPVVNMQVNKKTFYNLEFKQANGPTLKGGGMILGKDKAKRIIAEIMTVIHETE